MTRSKEPLQKEGEEWKRTKYIGYEVSNLGRVRSYWTPAGLGKKPRMKMPVFNRYMKVSIHVDGVKNTFVLLARLVAETFLGEADGRIIVYIDGDIRNCSLSNLAYATRREHGSILSKRRYQKDPEHSAIGKVIKRKEWRESRLERARKVKELRDNERLSFKEIGRRLGLSESGAFRIYRGANNQMLAKALSE